VPYARNRVTYYNIVNGYHADWNDATCPKFNRILFSFVLLIYIEISAAADIIKVAIKHTVLQKKSVVS
jgi:hypothetical protein